MARQGKTRTKRDRIGIALYVFYVLLLLVSLWLIGRLVYIQVFYKPDPKIERALTPRSTRKEIESTRGDILDCNGRTLALTVRRYKICMDCSVRKKEFAGIADAHRRDSLENEWMAKAKDLSVCLAELFPEHKSDWYYNSIKKNRERGNGFVEFGHPVDKQTFEKVQQFPLFREGTNKGGLILRKRDINKNVRRYPYGRLGSRAIGFIRDEDTGVGNRYVGIEGKFDKELSGKVGEEWLRVSDMGRVQDFDSTFVAAEDGNDIRSTLNIEYQEIADRALREQISNDPEIEGGCVILMDVKTGAIRAMVNLLRDNGGNLDETYNLAIGRMGEPGSVFKLSTLMSAIEDGYVHSLDECIPGNHGVIEGYRYAADEHIIDYEREHHTNWVPLLYCVEVSSNYAFRYLAITHYASHKEDFYNHIRKYHLADAFDFDLVGLAKPNFLEPDSKYWNKHDLGSVAMGYSITESPLHIVNFYNAIAGKGRMMKPYIVESIEKSDSVIKKFEPCILDSAICSATTAAILTEGLKGVTSEGTAKVLKDAKISVAGKTGTSRVVLSNGKYEMPDGKKKNQGTFVGFFPVEDPRYSIITVVYSKLSNRSFYGSGYPAKTVKTIIDELYRVDPYWRNTI